MSVKERLVSIGTRRGQRLMGELAEIGLERRLSLGLPRRVLARALGISPSKLARWEHAEPPLPNIVECAIWLRVLGQDLSAKCFPAGSPLRDVAHAKLVSRFLAVLPRLVPRTVEAPIPADRDLRAWDVLFGIAGKRIGVACETHLRDWQDLLRREQGKARDGGVDYVLFVLADTRANRRAVADAGAALREAFPLDGRTVRAALEAGRDPGGNGLLFL